MSDKDKVYKLDDLEVSKNKKRKKIDEAKKKLLESKMTNIQNPIFQKNLQALFQQDEILAAKLWSIDETKEFDVFVGKDPIDINLINNKTLKYVYENPVNDTLNSLESLEKEYKRYPIMFFYGLGNGVLYKALLKNETHKKIAVIEPEIDIIYATLNVVDLSSELLSQRLVLFYSEFASYAQFYFLITAPEFTSYAKTYDLHVHSPFYESYVDDILRINSGFTKAISQMVIAHGNSIDDMLIGVKHHVQNIPVMLENYCYRQLVLKRYNLNKTAIIVATGPSLDKQLDTLKKFAPYSTIISLDASYPILKKHGIVPDYVTSIERVEATSSFFSTRDKKFDENIYFIVASLTHPQTIKNILPRRLVLTMRPQQSEIAFNMKKYGYLGIGHSTANQAFQLAYALGHKNIVLIGQDLAFAPDGKSHATGHAFAQADEYLYVKAYGGEGEVRTTYIWDKFKNQYEKDIEQSSKEGYVTYNCTEGGARIEGSVEKPFLETMNELCKDKIPKKEPNISKISEKQRSKDLLKAYTYIAKKVKTQKEAKRKIEEVFLELVPQIDELIAKKEAGEVSEKMFSKLAKITSKIDRLKTYLSAKKHKLYIDNILQMSIYFQELELAKISVAPSDTIIQKVNKLLEWVEMHKYWMFSAAGGINADIEVTKKASKALVAELKKRKLITKNEIGSVKENFTLSI
ncbi:6-hydroxymethylpterin diphosphokinase MptE-like protein [Campylobacter concisus]|uniref:motility associated factor glycosyltransferase family protein n=1 Tax=Campylobacter concisus TaxID=199 RepID=UPI000D394189|nr:6-hydroxymethylpterin diphosphokinase MptE-like protein [Campylobacter concisus]